MSSKVWSSRVVALATVAVLLLVVGGLWAYVFASAGRASDSIDQQASPSSSSASTTQADTEPTWTTDDARDALAGDGSRVLVLGDSTGNGSEDWVSQWGQQAQMPVALWDTAGEAGYVDETEETRIWSGAMNRGTADYPLDHDAIWPAQDPDLVLLNYGHYEESGDAAAEGLEELSEQVADRYPEAPVVVVLQNPQADDANEPTRTAIADWAEGAGLPTIDVAAAFEDADSAQELLDGEINPSVAGSQLWAETVAEALR